MGKIAVKDWLWAGLSPVLIATIIGFVVFYSRNLIAVPDQSLVQVFLWQFLSFSPWIAIFPATRALLAGPPRPLVHWGIASLLVAFACTIWFILASQLASPYLGQPQTMFGLYKWFLIFWFALSFLLFWAHIGFYFLRTAAGHPLPVQSARGDERLLAISQSGGQTVVAKKDVVLIEAEDFYASILLANGKTYWVKMRLNDFLKELNSDFFVRGHRSAIINLAHLQEIKRVPPQGWDAVLTNGRRVRLSRAGKAALEKSMNVIR